MRMKLKSTTLHSCRYGISDLATAANKLRVLQDIGLIHVMLQTRTKKREEKRIAE